MATINDVVTVLGQSVNSALVAAGWTIPNQVVIGWPNYEDLTKIISASQTQVSVYDTGVMRETTRFPASPMYASSPSVTMAASVSGSSVTYSGTPGSGTNVFLKFATPLAYAQYKTAVGDTPNSVASAMASAVNSLGLSGISASASGATVTLLGVWSVSALVLGSAQSVTEVRRQWRRIQVSCWAPDPPTRQQMESIITSAIGTIAQPFYPVGDGTNLWIKYLNSAWDDQRQLDFSMFTAHCFFDVEYGTLQYDTMWQIGAAVQNWQFPGGNKTVIN